MVEPLRATILHTGRQPGYCALALIKDLTYEYRYLDMMGVLHGAEILLLLQKIHDQFLNLIALKYSVSGTKQGTIMEHVI